MSTYSQTVFFFYAVYQLDNVTTPLLTPIFCRPNGGLPRGDYLYYNCIDLTHMSTYSFFAGTSNFAFETEIGEVSPPPTHIYVATEWFRIVSTYATCSPVWVPELEWGHCSPYLLYFSPTMATRHKSDEKGDQNGAIKLRSYKHCTFPQSYLQCVSYDICSP